MSISANTHQSYTGITLCCTNIQDIVDVRTYTKLRAAENHTANATMTYHCFAI